MQRSVAALADHATAAVYTAASSRPRGQPNVFLYSDPGAGRDYGYRFDGWTQDRSVFLYTGEGTNGDQQFTDGNLAVQRHAEQARALRVFVADGSEPGGNTKIQRYLGQFRLDVDRPTATAEAPDTDGNLRSVIVFRLVPVGPVLRRSEDDSAVGDVSTEPRLDRVDHGDLTMTGIARRLCRWTPWPLRWSTRQSVATVLPITDDVRGSAWHKVGRTSARPRATGSTRTALAGRGLHNADVHRPNPTAMFDHAVMPSGGIFRRVTGNECRPTWRRARGCAGHLQG